jgi:phosphoribosylformylglycinamidine synthase
MLCDSTGRHLVMMPHFFNGTGHYPKDRNDEVSPWHEAFECKKWIDKKISFGFIYKSVLERGAFFFY